MMNGMHAEVHPVICSIGDLDGTASAGPNPPTAPPTLALIEARSVLHAPADGLGQTGRFHARRLPRVT